MRPLERRRILLSSGVEWSEVEEDEFSLPLLPPSSKDPDPKEPPPPPPQPEIMRMAKRNKIINLLSIILA